MTEFNPLLGKSRIEVSYNDSSGQEDETAKPLLRKKTQATEERVRYRPKSMSMLARSNYGSSEFQTSSTTLSSSERTLEVDSRSKSFTEASTHHTYVTETKAENLFVKSFAISSVQSQKVVKRSSESSVVSTTQVMRPMLSSEPLFIQELEPPGVSPAQNTDVRATPAVLPFESEKLSPRKEKIDSEVSSSSDEEEKREKEEDRSSITSDSSEDPESESKRNDPPPPQQNPQAKLFNGRQPIIPGVESTIEINKGISDLGINIIGGADTLLDGVYVLSVIDHEAAAKDGRLWPGDRILSANNSDLRSASHEEAIEVIRNSPAAVRLVIFRDGQKSKAFLRYQRKLKMPLLSYWDTINNEKESDVYDVYEVKLKKKQKRSLGLCIIGRRNDPGVFVTDVTVGSAAAKDKRIRKGDQILAINGKDIKMAGQEVAAHLVHNAHGEIHIRMGRLKAGIPSDLMDKSNENTDLDYNSGDDQPSITTIDRERKHTRFVEIEKPFNTTLGIYIAGGVGSPLGDVPIFVALIEDTKVIGNKLKVGDVITSVNGQSAERKTHDEVVAMMSTAEDMIILMQVHDPTPEITKLTSYLNEAVSKPSVKERPRDLENSAPTKQQEAPLNIHPDQIETMIY